MSENDVIQDPEPATKEVLPGDPDELSPESNLATEIADQIGLAADVPDVWRIHATLWRIENKDTDDEDGDCEEEDEIVGLEDEYATHDEAKAAYELIKKTNNVNVIAVLDPEEVVTVDRALGIAAHVVNEEIKHLRNLPNKALARARTEEKMKEYDRLMALIEKKKF